MATAIPNHSQAMPRRVGLRCSMRLVYRENRLFGVKYGFKEKDADGGEDDVVTGQLSDPTRDLDGIEICCEDAGRSLDHGQQGGQGDGEEQQGEEEFAVAGAQAEGGEEGSVDD